MGLSLSTDPFFTTNNSTEKNITISTNATSAATADTIVMRDDNSSFSGNLIRSDSDNYTTYKGHNTGKYYDSLLTTNTTASDTWLLLNKSDAQYGIYYRNINTNLTISGEETLLPQSIAYIGNNSLVHSVNLNTGDAFFKGYVKANQIVSGISTANGAPLAVKSSTMVDNLNANYVGGTSIDGLVLNNDIIQNTNPFGGKKLYINSINDALFRAESR